MRPFLALAVCIVFVWYLFRIDRRQDSDTSWALLLPLLWMFFASSRFLSRWLNMVGVPMAIGGEADGSPLDRIAFFLLIALGLMVLRSRRIGWLEFVVRNPFVWLFFLFGLASAIWSGDASIPLKRVPKAVGNVVMAMVVISDPRPWNALNLVLRRLAFLTLPLSVVFIKFFPEYGREYHSRGTQMFTGVGTQKNSLGELCLLAGLGCVWSLLYKPSPPISIPGLGLRIEWLVLGMVVWLMTYANSATSLVCLVVAAGILVVGRSGFGKTPKRIVGVTFVVGVVVGILELTVGLSAAVIEALGRRGDLTTRVPMWSELIATSSSNPWLGAGFESYWLTSEGAQAFANWQVRNAHNGYLEVFLSSGYTGLILVVAGLVMTLINIARLGRGDRSQAVMCLAILVVAILYNWTESVFRSVSTIWTLSFIAAFSHRIAPSASVKLTLSETKNLGHSRRNGITDATVPAPNDISHRSKRHLNTRAPSRSTDRRQPIR